MAHRRRGRTSRVVQYGGGNVEQSNRGDCGADWSGVEGKYKGLYSKFPALFELGPKENKVEGKPVLFGYHGTDKHLSSVGLGHGCMMIQYVQFYKPSM